MWKLNTIRNDWFDQRDYAVLNDGFENILFHNFDEEFTVMLPFRVPKKMPKLILMKSWVCVHTGVCRALVCYHMV
jgi:hypothetical protein